jgi:hypothetical protein
MSVWCPLERLVIDATRPGDECPACGERGHTEVRDEVYVCEQCLQLPKAEAMIARLRAFLVALRDHTADGNIRCSSCLSGQDHTRDCALVALLAGHP